MKSKTKLLVFFLFTIFFSLLSNAQSSAGMNYQAVIRNSSNALVANTTVGIKISILQSTSTGTVVYSERHTPTTNANGLATLIIGAGTLLSGNYGNINWGEDTYYLKTETDPTGGTNYTITNVSQFMSVPYAKYAENVGNAWAKTGSVVDVTTDFIGSTNNADVKFKRGYQSSGIIGMNSTALGVGSLSNNTGIANTAFGTVALNLNISGGSNVGIGYFALSDNQIGSDNTAVGTNALRLSTGFYNTAVGSTSLENATGDQNTAIGWSALGNITTGGGNIGIGKLVSVPSPTTNNQLSIGNVIYGTNMGNTASGTIGIGVPVPTEKLEVAGKTKTTDLQVTNGAGVNKVLTSDAIGNATWQTSNANTGINIEKNATQTIGTSYTKINFETEITDDANAFNLTTDDWTVPSAGFYHIYATVKFINSFPANTQIEMVVYVNGNPAKRYKHTGLQIFANYDISADIKLNANDIVSIYVYQSSGSNATIDSVAGNSYLSSFKVY